MASNHRQYISGEHDRNQGLSSGTQMLLNHDSASTGDGNRQRCHHQSNNFGPGYGDANCYLPPPSNKSQNTGYHAYQGELSSIANDALILRHRRTGLYNHNSRTLELMCEHKIAKNKLDLLHWSKPSSQKSTFMMSFSPNGQRVASTHGDHRIYICDLNTGQLIDTLEGHPKSPWCFSWHPTNNDILASGCLSGEVRVWDLRSKACELWTSDNNTIITSISFHPKERILAIATANAVHFWDWCETTPFAVTTSPFEKERVKYVEFDSTGSKLITGITNCTAISAYSRDSLQNRIIDSYLNNGNIQQIQSDNRQNSEISIQHNNQFISPPINSNENLGNTLHLNTQTTTTSTRPITNVDINLRSTITSTLSKIACLYKNLEALEDSIRNNSFATYDTSSQTPSNLVISDGTRATNNNQIQVEPTSTNSEISSSSQSDSTNKSQADPSDDRRQPETNPGNQASNRNVTTINPNSYEPLVVLFDELLENIQLSPMIIRGRSLDNSRMIGQSSIDLSNHLDYVVQFDSIKQVNQNFIRISKLMSSIRLYRQIIQQILASGTGQGHYQPNQFLTAQSTAHPNHGNHAQIPIVLRYSALPSAIGLIDQNQDTSDRPIDPIMAIQFRNCARNVPLAPICKVDLLNARLECLLRAQQNLESTLATDGVRPPDMIGRGLNESLGRMLDSEVMNTSQAIPNEGETQMNCETNIITAFYQMLVNLQRVLSDIIQTPLTTSNVHIQITSLRFFLDALLNRFQLMIQSNDESKRLLSLIHEISQHLTGRSWTSPLGRTFDELRLDVIHTFCMVDLTLHLSRQIQLLQMQRLSAISRMKDRTSLGQAIIQHTRLTKESNSSEPIQGPSDQRSATKSDHASAETSSSNITRENQESNSKIDDRCIMSNEELIDNPPGKRKNDYESSPSHSAQKKPKVEPDHMIESSQKEAMNPIDGEKPSPLLQNNSANMETHRHRLSVDHSILMQPSDNPTLDSAIPANTIDQTGLIRDISVRSGSTSQLESTQIPMPIEPTNVQRLYLAATPSTNLQILMRIIHRVQATTITSMVGGPLPDELASESGMNNTAHPPIEVRRRALSHDNSSMGSAETRPEAELSPHNPIIINRPRIVTASPSNYGPNSSHLDVWPRHQFHIIIPNHTRGQNVLWMTLPSASSNYRLQCWDFSPLALPDIKDAVSKVVVNRCRIDTNASIDISKDGHLIACLVPQEDPGSPMINRYDLKVISLNSQDFGACLYSLPQGPQAISISLSPSAKYVVVGLSNGRHSIFGSANQDDPDGLSIAKVYGLSDRRSFEHVRDIKIKRQGPMNLNAIRWMPRGIVYNVGQHPMYHHRYPHRRVNHQT